jgi:hypothetical protein
LKLLALFDPEGSSQGQLNEPFAYCVRGSRRASACRPVD